MGFRENLSFVLNFVDGTKRGLKTAKTNTQAYRKELLKTTIEQRELARATRDSRTILLSLGAAIGVVTSSLKTYLDAQDDLVSVKNLVPQKSEAIGIAYRQLRNDTIALGVSQKDLAEGLFNVVSASGFEEDTQARLNLAAKVAVANRTDLKDITALLNTVQASYNDTSYETAKSILNTATVVERFAITTFPELVKAIQATAGPAAAIGIPFENLASSLGALASVSRATVGEVAIQVRELILSSMTKPSAALKDVFIELGVNGFRPLIEESGDLVTALQTIVDKGAEMGIALAKLIPQTNALNFTQQLLGNRTEQYREILEGTKNSQTALAENLERRLREGSVSWDRFVETVKNVADTFGRILAPTFEKLFGVMLKIKRSISELTAEQIENISKTGEQVVVFTTLIVAVFGVTSAFIVLRRSMILLAGINPIGATIVAIGIALALIVKFREQIADAVSLVVSGGVNALNNLKALVGFFFNNFLRQKFKDAATRMRILGKIFENVWNLDFDAVSKNYRQLTYVGVVSGKKIAAEWKKTQNNIQRDNENFIDKSKDLIGRPITEALSDLEKKFEIIREKISNFIGFTDAEFDGFVQEQLKGLISEFKTLVNLTGGLEGQPGLAPPVGESQLAATRNFFEGVRRASLALQEDLADITDDVTNMWNNAFDNATKSLVDFVMTGKLSFKDLIDSMIRDLLRLLIQQQILGPLFNMVGAFAGSFAPPAGQTGGINTSPLGSGTTLDYTPASNPFGPTNLRFDSSDQQRMGPPVQVNIVNNVPGTETNQEEGQDSQGNPTIEVVFDQLESRFSERARRGTKFSSELENLYGLDRTKGRAVSL